MNLIKSKKLTRIQIHGIPMDAPETLIICRNKEDEIVGYCQRAIDGHPDRFGPFWWMNH